MGRLKKVLRTVYNQINRKLLSPINSSNVSSFLSNKEPVSRKFGFDRGMPIDRYYIEHFLNINRQFIKGTTLEIAESTYTQKFGEHVSEKLILNYQSKNSQNQIVGDLTDHQTLPHSKIDCFICTQTFNFIYHCEKAIEGAYLLLKEGGVLLATVGGLSQISRYDMDRWGDYWRFTDLSARKMFGKIFGEHNIQIITYGNAATATAFIQGLAVEDLMDKNILHCQDPDYQIIIGVVAIK